MAVGSEKAIDTFREVSITPMERAKAIEAVKRVRKGDIILVKTPNVIFDLARKIYATPYDHVVVVVDEQSCLHISYPRTKIVPTHQFTLAKYTPLRIRPILEEKELDAFIREVIEESLQKPYDLGRFAKTMSSKFYNGVVAKV